MISNTLIYKPELCSRSSSVQTTLQIQQHEPETTTNYNDSLSAMADFPINVVTSFAKS